VCQAIALGDKEWPKVFKVVSFFTPSPRRPFFLSLSGMETLECVGMAFCLRVMCRYKIQIINFRHSRALKAYFSGLIDSQIPSCLAALLHPGACVYIFWASALGKRDAHLDAAHLSTPPKMSYSRAAFYIHGEAAVEIYYCIVICR
jgi:hypothetical protein